MKQILQQHVKDYPQAQLQDFFKLIHQSEFGPGHLIADAGFQWKKGMLKPLKLRKIVICNLII